MISKGKRKFLVRVYAINEFFRKMRIEKRVDVFALAALSQRLSGKLGKGRFDKSEIKPWTPVSLEGMARYEVLFNDVMKEYAEDGKEVIQTKVSHP